MLPAVAVAVSGSAAPPRPARAYPSSKSVTVKATGRAALSYVDEFFGPVRVNETHHGGCNPGNFDTLGETLSHRILPMLGRPSPSPGFSDFNASGLITSCDGQLGYAVITVAPDGLSFSGDAYYPNG